VPIWRARIGKSLAQLFGPKTKPRTSGPRLGLEVLEDRLNPVPVIYTVTNNFDAGAGSLRAAIVAHQTVSMDAGDAIYFQIDNPNQTVQKVDLLTALPEITIPVRIDGTQQQGYMIGKPIVQINDADAGTGRTGLYITGGNSTVTGVMITNFPDTAILLSGTGGNQISNCYLGTDGTKALGNNYGILVRCSSNQIGDVGKGNVISGNTSAGIYVQGDTTAVNLNTISSNYVGTNAAGNAAVANGSGIVVSAGSGSVTNTTLSNNVISGNSGDGVSMSGSLSTNTVLTGNIIGLTSNGYFGLGNGGVGVGIYLDSNNNEIGQPNAGNVISDNVSSGVFISGATNKVLGNLIGTDATGFVGAGNGGNGVWIFDAANNDVGGTVAGSGNLISDNGLDGVRIDGSTAHDDYVQGNTIGLAVDGMMAGGNGGNGVEVSGGAYSNYVGGANAGNVISANTADGVLITGAAATNKVQDNYVGLTASGLMAAGNGVNGVEVNGGSTDTTIGGGAAGQGNVISGNTRSGVYVKDAATNRTKVYGNLIGTDSAGAAGKGNWNYGVEIAYARNTEVGGDATAVQGNSLGQGNVISDNDQGGVLVRGDSTDTASGTLVRGNLIGTDKGNTEALGNHIVGVAVYGAQGVVIGGTDDTKYGNTIVGTKGSDTGDLYYGHGVLVYGYADGTTIQGNWIGIGGVDHDVSMGNAGSGVYAQLHSSNTVIGGSSALAGNIIGANGVGNFPDCGYGIDAVGGLQSVDYNWVGLLPDETSVPNQAGSKGGGGGITWGSNNHLA
jgi:hypothetical protein